MNHLSGDLVLLLAARGFFISTTNGTVQYNFVLPNSNNVVIVVVEIVVANNVVAQIVVANNVVVWIFLPKMLFSC